MKVARRQQKGRKAILRPSPDGAAIRLRNSASRPKSSPPNIFASRAPHGLALSWKRMAEMLLTTRLITFFVGAIALAAWSPSGRAGVLSLPQAQIYAFAAGDSTMSFGVVTDVLCTGPPNSLCSTQTAGTDGMPGVNVSGAGAIGANAGASVAYDVAVLGPGGLVPVTGYASGQADGGTTVSVAASFAGFGGTACSGSDGCGMTPSSFSISQTFLVQACDLSLGDCGESFGASVSALGNTQGSDPAFSASGDPFFQIDPSFLAAHPGYSLAFSAGIVNSSPFEVPEPSTLCLMIAGLTAFILTLSMRDSRSGIGRHKTSGD